MGASDGERRIRNATTTQGAAPECSVGGKGGSGGGREGGREGGVLFLLPTPGGMGLSDGERRIRDLATTQGAAPECSVGGKLPISLPPSLPSSFPSSVIPAPPQPTLPPSLGHLRPCHLPPSAFLYCRQCRRGRKEGGREGGGGGERVAGAGGSVSRAHHLHAAGGAG